MAGDPYSLIQSPPACTKLAQGSEINKQAAVLIESRFNWLVKKSVSSIGMTAAILLVIEKFRDFHGTKIMCLITDGEPDHKEATRLAARKAKRSGIDIMAIGTDDADRAFLSKLTTRRELAVTVSSDKFEHAISSMAVCLPAPHR